MKKKLIVSFTIIILINGIISAVVGTLLISNSLIKQVQDRVRNDLNSARVMWNNRIGEIKNAVYFASLRNSIKYAIVIRDRKLLSNNLREIWELADIDILTIMNSAGKVICRIHNPDVYGDMQTDNQLIKKVLLKRQAYAASLLIERKFLEKEGDEFVRRSQIKYIKTPRAKAVKEEKGVSGLMIAAAAPVWGEKGNFIGIIYGGVLTNRNYRLVDRIKSTVYKDERYRGMDMGAATISQRDVRIATNVMMVGGERAIGTRVSEQVYDKVLGEGKRWIDWAFVVNAGYITAYEPIRDVDEKIIGMLGVGMLEHKFTDIRNRTLLILFSITVAGMIITMVVSNFFSNKITGPVNYLVKVSQQISGGNYNVRVDVKTDDELGELEKAYNTMTAALKERDERLKELSRTDPLTGALNRRAFFELTETELKRAQRLNQSITVAYIDLDNFKVVNDTLGHSTGDELLRAVSEIITHNIRDIDILSRIGGDEFIILFSNTDAQSAIAISEKLNNKLLAVMKQKGWPVTFSIGLVTHNSKDGTINEIVKKADELMYAVKQSGKNAIKHSIEEGR